jgi:thiol-disulfide isomerase/thioredoxin
MSTPWLVAFFLLSALVAMLSVLVVGLMRRIAATLEHLEPVFSVLAPRHGLAPGSKAPDFVAYDAEGELVRSHSMVRRRIILFLSSECQPCRQLKEQLAETAWAYPEVQLVAVLEDDLSSRSFSLPRWITPIFEREREVSNAFRTEAVPNAFAIDAQGIVIGSRPPRGPSDLIGLANELMEGGDGTAGELASTRPSTSVI